MDMSGIVRPVEVIELARVAGLDLACAVVLLHKESGGGQNVWGHDGVRDGGLYVKGSPVTREAYLAYKARRGVLGAQGVGPCQLTWSGYQDQADAAGGCWDWRANCATGFKALAGLIGQYGERQGFRRYNGSGPAAEGYATDAVRRLTALREANPIIPGPTSSMPTLRRGDRSEQVAALQRFMARNFPSYAAALPASGLYGDLTVTAVAEFQRRAQVVGTPLDGTIVGPSTNAALYGYGYRA